MSNSVDLVVTDYSMPRMDGIEFARLFRDTTIGRNVPIVMVTMATELATRYEALDAGVADFLNKPLDIRECRARIRNLLTLSLQRRALAVRGDSLKLAVDTALRDVQLREREALLQLAKAGEYRDGETGQHLLRMAKYSRLIADTLGLPAAEAESIELAAPLHDIGKIGIPDNVLLKRGRHDSAESAIMRTHSKLGYDLLRNGSSKYSKLGAQIAFCHHERFDGLGYPRGLRGDEIPLEARIVAVADVFDALTSRRPYKAPWRVEDALSHLCKGASQQFDPQVVDAFSAMQSRAFDIAASFEDRVVMRPPDNRAAADPHRPQSALAGAAVGFHD